MTRALLLHLRRLGQAAMLVEQPDRLPEARRTFSAVTSDALFQIRDNQAPAWWATDVMGLAAPASHHIVLNGLNERLAPIAQEHKIVYEIDGVSPKEADLKPLSRALAKATKEAPQGGMFTQGGLNITWRQRASLEEPDVNIVTMLLDAPSASLSDQIEATIHGPLIKKATIQAERAKDAGCHTAVLIDWTGHTGIAQGTHWLPQHHSTVAKAVTNVLSSVNHSLDAVLLLDRDGKWQLLYGGFPGFGHSSSWKEDVI